MIPSHLEPLKSVRTLRVKWLPTGRTSEEQTKASARAFVHAGRPFLQTLILHVDTRHPRP